MKICVVGCGPVGCLSACVLAQDGHEVTVFEKRPDPRSFKLSSGITGGGRSINLSLSTRGIEALASVGLNKDVTETLSVPVDGRLIHRRDGTCEASYYGLDRELLTYSVNRQQLNDMLLRAGSYVEITALFAPGRPRAAPRRLLPHMHMVRRDQATDRYPNVRKHFSTKIVQAHLTKGELTVECKESQAVVHAGPFDLVLGCDGAHSVVRTEMLRLGHFNFTQQSIPHGYVEMRFPATPDGQFALPPNFVHIWPRGDFLMIALPNLDRTYTVSLFLPHARFDELNAGGPETVLDFFRHDFPDAVPLLGEKTLLASHPLAPSSLMTIRCEPYHFGRAVLLGDAAHAVVPFYAQGMNAGLEDCLIFRDILRSALRAEYLDISAMLERYSSFRAPDGHAISQLSLYNYSELSTLVTRPLFRLRKSLDLAIHRLLGRKWELMYNSVTFSRQRYSACLEKKQAQDEALRRMGAFAGLILMVAIFISCFSL